MPLFISGILFVCLILLVISINMAFPLTYTVYNTDMISYEKGTVTAVLEEHLSPSPDMPGRQLGSQRITVRLDSGRQKGREITIHNYLSTTHNIPVSDGQAVIVKADRPENAEPLYSLYNYNRTPGLIAAAVVFLLLMIFVGRWAIRCRPPVMRGNMISFSATRFSKACLWH